jgi:hypothetical protein
VLKPDGLGLGEWRPPVLDFGPRKPLKKEYHTTTMINCHANTNAKLNVVAQRLALQLHTSDFLHVVLKYDS